MFALQECVLQCHHEYTIESEAIFLAELRDATSFKGWSKNKMGWATIEAHKKARRCDGVTVNDLGYVIKINLPDTNLLG